MNDIAELRKRLSELVPLRATLALVSWDQQVYMPEKAAPIQADMLAYLSGELHRRFLAINKDKLLTQLATALEKKELHGDDAVIVRETWRDYTHAAKLPEAFVKEYAEVTSRGQHEWQLARKDNDFARFKPSLERIVELSRKKAAYLGGRKAPYDALLDIYEPGMTADQLSITFAELKEVLVPLVEKIARAKGRKSKAYRSSFPAAAQRAFLDFVNEKIGFDTKAGRLDASAHPFTNGAHPLDVRMTTRYDEKDPWPATGSNIHEAGHALYEQGLPASEIGTPLSEAVSLGIHESQSRFWENMVGKNKRTWRYLFPRLKAHFPRALSGYTADDFYRRINEVAPSLIRTESDEATYNLHIIIRFEIEKALIEGSMDINELPEIWNDKTREYLGIRVPNDANGVLQDVHWSAGLIGYFPTYTLGNLYSAQILCAIRRDMPDFEAKLGKGQFIPIRDWLRDRIHRHGRRYSADELMKRATGSPLAVAPFADYLTTKYSELYNL